MDGIEIRPVMEFALLRSDRIGNTSCQKINSYPPLTGQNRKSNFGITSMLVRLGVGGRVSMFMEVVAMYSDDTASCGRGCRSC